MDYITTVIIGCVFVTFIPRLISALFVEKIEFSPKAEKFLNLIPYTSLTALICPGVLTVDSHMWYIGLIGAVVAAALAWKKVLSPDGWLITSLKLVGLWGEMEILPQSMPCRLIWETTYRPYSSSPIFPRTEMGMEESILARLMAVLGAQPPTD